MAVGTVNNLDVTSQVYCKMLRCYKFDFLILHDDEAAAELSPIIHITPESWKLIMHYKL